MVTDKSAGLPLPQQAARASDTRQQRGSRLRSTRHLLLLLALSVSLGIYTYSQQRLWSNPFEHKRVSQDYLDDLAQCRWDAQRVSSPRAAAPGRVNPRAVDHGNFLLRNATVIDGDGQIIGLRDVLIKRGTITTISPVGEGLSAENEQDLGGRYLTPGVIDMHSHAGVRPLPQFKMSEDVTEMGPGFSETTPYLLALDGFDPSDDALPRLISGGVTSSLILTGAQNLISGQGMAIKLRVPSSLSVEEMQIQHLDPPHFKRQRYMKMACGENPKSRGRPQTRLGENWLFKEAYAQAQDMKHRQDEWCAKAQAGRGDLVAGERYPKSREVQPLVDVLRGDVRVNVHCYKTEDIEAILRLAKSNGFNISALHHAVDTWRMIPQLEPFKPLTLALFASEYGFKHEYLHASINNPALMHEAGFDVALVTDHPAVNGQYPMAQASLSYNFGLPHNASLASLFSVPARTLGLDDRIGYIREGYDADLVVWDDHPLRVGAMPLQVWIDGEQQIHGGGSDMSSISWQSAKLRDAPAQRGIVEDDVFRPASIGSNVGCALGAQDMVLYGVDVSLHPTFETRPAVGEANVVVVVRGGKLVCAGKCEVEKDAAFEAGAVATNFTDGHLMPGLTQLTPMHGLTDILGESSTSDGYVDPTSVHATHAKYGLQPGGRLVDRASNIGITTIVTPPRAPGPALNLRMAKGGWIKGVSMAFHSGAKHAAEEGVFVKEDVAMHVTLGDAAKNAKQSTTSRQVQELRELLALPPDADWKKVADGEMVLAVHAESMDTIAQVINLARDVPSLRAAIVGGAEAHLVAPELAATSIGVILSPWRCMQFDWESRRCHANIPLTDENSVQVLLAAGVKVGLGATEDRHTRDMWFEAAWAAKPASAALELYKGEKLGNKLALDLIAKNVEDILGLEVDHASSFSVWEGNPFEYGAKPGVVFDRGRVEKCWPSF